MVIKTSAVLHGTSGASTMVASTTRTRCLARNGSIRTRLVNISLCVYVSTTLSVFQSRFSNASSTHPRPSSSLPPGNALTPAQEVTVTKQELSCDPAAFNTLTEERMPVGRGGGVRDEAQDAG